jgi:hypothetical protein
LGPASSRRSGRCSPITANYVGPTAKILIEKAANKARSAEDLCEQLATHVKVPSDRATFLRAKQRRKNTVEIQTVKLGAWSLSGSARRHSTSCRRPAQPIPVNLKAGVTERKLKFVAFQATLG